MSKEAAAKFFEKLESDTALKKQVEGTTAVAEITALGKASGFEFTDSEYEAAARTPGGDSLSDQQLDGVAGGMGISHPTPGTKITKPSTGC